MAYLNENYNQYTFVQHYLQRCSQVQRAADSDPAYQEGAPNNEQPPVIVLDDDDDEVQIRYNFSERIDSFLSNPSTNVDSLLQFRRQSTNRNFLDAPESSDLRITGVGVLKEWIDISELDLRKYANFCNLKERSLRESEEKRYRNCSEQRKRNGEDRSCAGWGMQKVQALNGHLEDGLTKQSEERRNVDIGTTKCYKIDENRKKERHFENQKRQKCEKNSTNRNAQNNLLKQILEGRKYTNSEMTNEEKNDVICIDLENENDAKKEATKPILPRRSGTNCEEGDMTWADLNVEEDIDTDEEKRNEVKKVQNEAQTDTNWLQNEETQSQNEETGPRSEENGRYRCTHCSYRTSWKSNLTKHIVSRHKSSEEIRWFQCALCPYKGKTREYLRVHLRLNHEQFITWHSCPTCPFKFKSKQLLQGHVLAIHTAPEDIKWFECDQCDFKCKFKQRLKYHKINKHLGENEIRWFGCERCCYRGKNKKSLRKHVLNRHTDYDQIGWIKCERCEFECKENSRLNAHVRLCHPEGAESRRAGIADDRAEEELGCKMCGFKTRSKMDYQEHFRFEGSSCYWRMRNT